MKEIIVLLFCFICDFSYGQTAVDYIKRGNKRFELNDYTGAISNYNKAIKIQPNYSYAYMVRGEAKYNLLDYRGALIDFDSSIEQMPILFIGHYLLRGDTKIKLHDYDGAFEDYSRAMDMMPENPEPYYKRGILYLMTDNTNKGCIDLSKAGELGNKEAYTLIKKYCQ